jgi:hypothetical protein
MSGSVLLFNFDGKCMNGIFNSRTDPGANKNICMTRTNPTRTSFKLKLLSFLAGLGLLIAGSLWLDFPDWDTGISILMAISTFATAQWSTSVFWERRWKSLVLAAFWTWLSVDGSYWAYWSYVNPAVMIREGQWLASLCLYALCGVIWYRLVPMAAELVDQRLDAK